jgi:hypothetical protein
VRQWPAVPGSCGKSTELTERSGLPLTAALPEIYPLTVAGAQGRGEPAELAVPAALTQKWPAPTSLEGAPAFNLGRAYAAFAADIDNGTHSVPDFADAVRRHEVIAASRGPQHQRNARRWRPPLKAMTSSHVATELVLMSARFGTGRFARVQSHSRPER